MITTKTTVAGVLLLGAMTTGFAFATTAAAAADPLPSQNPAGTRITVVPVNRELAVSPDGTRINFAVPGTREGVVSPDGTRINF